MKLPKPFCNCSLNKPSPQPSALHRAPVTFSRRDWEVDTQHGTLTSYPALSQRSQPQDADDTELHQCGACSHCLEPPGWMASLIYFSTWNAIRGFTLFLLQKQHHKNPWWLELQLSYVVCQGIGYSNLLWRETVSGEKPWELRNTNVSSLKTFRLPPVRRLACPLLPLPQPHHLLSREQIKFSG